MSELPAWLQRLDAALEALPKDRDAMGLSCLDGYLTGVAVSPESIAPEEWLPHVGRGPNAAEGDHPLPPELVKSVMQLHREIAERLRRSNGCLPLFAFDDDDEVLWEDWVGGFVEAMHLREEAWQAIVDGEDERAAEAVSGLLLLESLARVGGAETEIDMSQEQEEALLEDAPDLIPAWVEDLHAARRRRPVWVSGAVEKPGRNAPCPCGSGKKYKQCCGHGVS